MSQWKFTDATNRVVERTFEDGRHESCLASVLPVGTDVLPADPPPPPNVRQQILEVSQQALASGFLHVIMFDLMQRYLAQAQAIVPTVTEADLLDVNGPYYSKPYSDTRTYYLQLVSLQDAK